MFREDIWKQVELFVKVVLTYFLRPSHMCNKTSNRPVPKRKRQVKGTSASALARQRHRELMEQQEALERLLLKTAEQEKHSNVWVCWITLLDNFRPPLEYFPLMEFLFFSSAKYAFSHDQLLKLEASFVYGKGIIFLSSEAI